MFNFDLTDEQLDEMPARKFLKMIDSQREAMRNLAPVLLAKKSPQRLVKISEAPSRMEEESKIMSNVPEQVIS